MFGCAVHSTFLILEFWGLPVEGGGWRLSRTGVKCSKCRLLQYLVFRKCGKVFRDLGLVPLTFSKFDMRSFSDVILVLAVLLLTISC